MQLFKKSNISDKVVKMISINQFVDYEEQVQYEIGISPWVECKVAVH